MGIESEEYPGRKRAYELAKMLEPAPRTVDLLLSLWPRRVRYMCDPVDFNIVAVGFEHLRAVQDLSFVETLLKQVTVEEKVIEDLTYTQLSIPSWSYEQLSKYIVFQLIAEYGPQIESLQALLKRVTFVDLNGDHVQYGWDRDFPIDLAPLGRFESLRRLHVSCSAALMGLEALGGTPKLEHLEISASGDRFSATLATLFQDSGFLPRLKGLILKAECFDIQSLGERPIESLRVASLPNVSHLNDLSSLQRLHLGAPIHLKHIRNLKKLQHLYIGGKKKCKPSSRAQLFAILVIESEELEVLGELPELVTARIPVVPTEEALAWLNEHPNIERLEINCEGKKGRSLRKRLSEKYPRLEFVR